MPPEESEMRPDSAMQDVHGARTPRAMYLPPSERVASAGEADNLGTGPDGT